MNYDFFKLAGAVAGIGGLALASVVYIFREVIRRQIFPQLTRGQAYKLLNRIVVLTFVIGVVGIGAFLVVNLQGQDNRNVRSTGDTPTPTPQTIGLSGTVLDHDEKPLQGAIVSLDDFPGMSPVETSSNGVFNLERIPKSSGEGVRVRVLMAGYHPNPYTEDVVLGKTPPIIILTKNR